MAKTKRARAACPGISNPGVGINITIIKAIIAKEGQWIFGKNAHKKTIYYSDIEKNIHLLDFEKLIKESIAAGEKRIAIRY